MTERKRWPNHAEWARTESIALAHRGIMTVSPLINHSEIDVVRRAATSLDCLNRIIITLVAVGPQVEKDPVSTGQSQYREITGSYDPEPLYQK
jgi:hypothetical protein